MPEIYQLSNGLYVEEKATEFGGYLVYSDYVDTDSNKINPAVMDAYQGSPQHKIPNRLWNRMVTFFMHYLADNTEVECRYYKRNSEFICVVGNQSVTGASVTYNYALPLYGLDGIRYTTAQLVAEGWVLYAHFHLHPFDMPSPSGIDDTNEMGTPLLYGIISIPTDRKSTLDYRVRTTLVANNGYENRRYFPNSWDFIDLPVSTELQEYRPVSYDPVCETQVKRFVYLAPVTTLYKGGTKWLKPSTVSVKSLAEKLQDALEAILISDFQLTVTDIEKELPAVLSELLQSELFTYDAKFTDPFYVEY